MLDQRPPRVLVIPGIDGHTGLWQSVAPTALHGLRPVWFDHSRDRAAGGLDGLAERALRVLDADAEGEAPALVLGESFGGPVALTLARRYPHRVRGLLLLSTFAWYPSQFTGRVGLAVSQMLGDSVSHQLLRLWHPLSLPGALGLRFSPALARAYVTRPVVDIGAYRAKCELALGFDARAWLHEIQHPTFVLVGAWDPVVPTSASHALVRRIPRARLQRLGGGHLMWSVRSAEVGGLVTEWLRGTAAEAV